VVFCTLVARASGPVRLPWLDAVNQSLVSDLVSRHGESQRAHIERMLEQLGDFWREEDGDAEAYRGS